MAMVKIECRMFPQTSFSRTCSHLEHLLLPFQRPSTFPRWWTCYIFILKCYCLYIFCRCKSCEVIFTESRRRRRQAAEPAPLPEITRSRSLKMLGVDIASDFSISHVTLFTLAVHLSNHVQRAHRQYTRCVCWDHTVSAMPLCNTCTGPPSLRGWRTPLARGAVSPRRLIASASTRWSTTPTAMDTARQICHRLTNCVTLQTTSFSARLCICQTTSCVHCCRRHSLHYNVTICENAHIHCSCLSIQFICQTVILSHTRTIKTFIRPRKILIHTLLFVGYVHAFATLALYRWTGSEMCDVVDRVYYVVCKTCTPYCSVLAMVCDSAVLYSGSTTQLIRRFILCHKLDVHFKILGSIYEGRYSRGPLFQRSDNAAIPDSV